MKSLGLKLHSEPLRRRCLMHAGKCGTCAWFGTASREPAATNGDFLCSMKAVTATTMTIRSVIPKRAAGLKRHLRVRVLHPL
jgi:hypothetical protein